MINTAVILAAGMGTRLRSVLSDIPKGFLEVNGRTLIERSLESLRQAGIKRCLLVTGHLAGFYDALAAKPAWQGWLETVHNPDFAISGSMYSLYTARKCLEEDFILLESDLIYETRALKTIIETELDNTILLSGKTDSGDEVYAAAAQGRITHLSKKPEELPKISGELVGISRISLPFYQKMLELAEVHLERSLKMDYEDCLVESSRSIPLNYIKLEDLIWAEIDDEQHLERVQKKILPALQQKSGEIRA